MSLRLCTFIRPDGHLCASPALRGHRLCYYHYRDTQYALKVVRDRRHADVCDWELPTLNTPQDRLRALQRILNELAAGRLAADRAGRMLYAIQQASIPPKTASPPQKPPANPKGMNTLPVTH